jgi:hypothetical protein
MPMPDTGDYGWQHRKQQQHPDRQRPQQQGEYAIVGHGRRATFARR